MDALDFIGVPSKVVPQYLHCFLFVFIIYLFALAIVCPCSTLAPQGFCLYGLVEAVSLYLCQVGGWELIYR